MQFPILAKDLRLSLRRLESFISAFTFYSVMTVTVGFLWEVNIHGSSSFYAARDTAARQLFLGFIVLGFIGFCFHGGISAARILVQERERNTYALLQATPLSPWKLILEKLFTPLAFELLLFFGVFPVLALVFIIGGISPQEYAYQLTNLFVWILTSLTLGLWNSSRSYTTTKAVRRTTLYLLISIFVAPYLALYLFGLAQGNPEMIAATLFRFVSVTLFTMTPAGMILSYYVGEASGSSFLFTRGSLLETVVRGPITLMGGHWKIGWTAHICLQVLFLVLTARNWRKVTSESKEPGSSSQGFAKRSYPLFSMPTYLPTGIIAFFANEHRVIFGGGNRIKTRLAWSYFLSALAAVFFGYGQLLALLSLGAILFFSLALAPNSFRREREQGTAVFLLGTPYHPRDYLLGKWVYLQAVGFSIVLLGLSLVLLWTMILQLFTSASEYSQWARGMYSRRFHISRIYLYLALLVPMITLEGLMIGLRIRQKVRPIRFLVPIGVLAAGWLLLYMAQVLNRRMGNVALWQISDFVYNNPWPVGVVVPYLLIWFCAWLLRYEAETFERETWQSARRKRRIAAALVVYVGIDFLSLLAISPEFDRFDPRNHLRLLTAAAAFNWFPWVWLAHRPESWWRERLLGPGAA